MVPSDTVAATEERTGTEVVGKELETATEDTTGFLGIASKEVSVVTELGADTIFVLGAAVVQGNNVDVNTVFEEVFATVVWAVTADSGGEWV